MKEKKVTIVGAGIGGLMTAIALQKKNIDFEIYESFSEMKNVGAGIMLANNAMQVMKILELHEEITEKGCVFHRLNLRDPEMNLLTSSVTTDFSPDPIPTVAIGRSVLQAILLAQIPIEKLHLGRKLLTIKEAGDGLILNFEDGLIIGSSTVIGADGIHSVVRNSIHKNCIIRSANQNCWRGISEMNLPEKFASDLNEIWGNACRFGFVLIAPKKVYWYALKDQKPQEQMEKKELLSLFSDFDPVVNQLISKCPENEILNNPIKDLKPIKNWTKGNICLIGDAAHATTPNLGQGACQSIEDALTIANCIAKESDYQMAFDKFEQLRIKKATWVVKLSWRVGKLSHLKNKGLIALRNVILKRVPRSVQKKQNEKLFNLSDLN